LLVLDRDGLGLHPGDLQHVAEVLRLPLHFPGDYQNRSLGPQCRIKSGEEVRCRLRGDQQNMR
jgi:hypothetical protein